MLRLGVNIDHVATIREARGTVYPSPLEAALACEDAGADGITAHLREDRRHIQDLDILRLRDGVKRLNLEMAATDEMVSIAREIIPSSVCLVPEKREELTTEGGLNVSGSPDIGEKVSLLRSSGITVSLFIDPDETQVEASRDLGAEYVELHTGRFAEFPLKSVESGRELARLSRAAELADSLGLKVNAGHGINYENISGVLHIPHLDELNIGHSIISRAVFTGIYRAVLEMIESMKSYSGGIPPDKEEKNHA